MVVSQDEPFIVEPILISVGFVPAKPDALDTCKLAPGLVVPIPTSPVALIAIFVAFAILKK